MSAQTRRELDAFNNITPARGRFDGKRVVMTSAEGAARGTVPTGLGYVIEGTVNSAATGVIKAAIGGSGAVRTVTLDLTNVLIDAIAETASEAVGVLLYTLPAGACIVRGSYFNLSLVGSEALIDADVPDVGLGTVIGTGAVAVLGGTSTFEDILTGQTFGVMSASVPVAKTISLDTGLVIETGDAHTVHLNIAEAWADADTGVYANGRIIIEYTQLA